jgi:hypothetical protein
MKKIIIATLAVSALGWAGAAAVRADDSTGGDKVFEADKGPDKIDVSKYPKAKQEEYAVFTEKCSKCHTIARPINSDYALPEEWTAYVDKMRHKKRSGIDEDSQKAITDFLIYDSSVRKKDLIAKKLKDKEAAGKGGKKDAAGDKKDAPKADSDAKTPAKP